MEGYFTQQFFSTETKDGKLNYNNPLALLRWDNDFRLPYDFVLSVSGEYQSSGNYADEHHAGYGMLNVCVRERLMRS